MDRLLIDFVVLGLSTLITPINVTYTITNISGKIGSFAQKIEDNN